MGQKVNPHGFRLGITTAAGSWTPTRRVTLPRLRREDVAIRKLISKGMERPASPASRSSAPVTGSAWTSTPPVRASSSVAVAPRPTASAVSWRSSPASRSSSTSSRSEPRDRGPSSWPRASPSSCLPRVLPSRHAQGHAVGHARWCQGHPGPGAPVVSAAPRCPVRSSTARAGCRCTRCARTSTTASYEAKTTFGRIGVKVWIYKGDLTAREPGGPAGHRAAPGPWPASRRCGPSGPRPP